MNTNHNIQETIRNVIGDDFENLDELISDDRFDNIEDIDLLIARSDNIEDIKKLEQERDKGT
jgi:hypothetical protein